MALFKEFCAAFTIALCLCTGAAARERDKKSLEKINQEIERKKKEAARLEAQSKKLDSEIKDTQKKMVGAAENIKRYERQMLEYDRRMSGLSAKERQLNRVIEGNNAELVKVIAVFENMSQVPRGYLLASPSKIESVFHTSLLLRSVARQLDRMRVKFRGDLDEMIKVEAEISKARKGVAGVNAKLKKEKDRMGGLVKSKRAAHRQAAAKNESTRAEIKKLVAESKTIEEFLKKAEEMRRRQEAGGTRPRTVSRRFAGKAPLPVVGRIAAYFGDRRAAGVKSKGLYIQAKRGAQVVSPLDASVVFAGSFYGYRNLLILRNTDGYYVIMGGMDDVLASEGQNLLAGEPVGEAGSGELYVEVRENEKLVDPVGYFKI